MDNIVETRLNTSKEIVDNSSRFTGDMKQYYFIRLVSFLAKLFSLGILYPFITCWQMKWEASHTYISGKRLVFTGKPLSIFTKFIYWWFLSLITLGIFYFKKGKFALHKWKIKHTHFEGYDKKSKSKYKGSLRKFNKAQRRAVFIQMITIGFGSCWAHCYFEKWSAKKTIIDGYQLSFNGNGKDYFKRKAKGIILTILTLGIYSFWQVINTKKWEISHTYCKKIENEQKKEEKLKVKNEQQLESIPCENDNISMDVSDALNIQESSDLTKISDNVNNMQTDEETESYDDLTKDEDTEDDAEDDKLLNATIISKKIIRLILVILVILLVIAITLGILFR